MGLGCARDRELLDITPSVGSVRKRFWQSR